MSGHAPAGDLVAGRDGAPSLVVLGAPRCGTTAVAAWLAAAGLGVGVKDSFYLMDADAGLRGTTHLSTHGVSGYLSLFPAAGRPAVECAAGYLYQRTALEFFASWARPPRFAVLVRDPTDRLRSVYRYFYGNLGMLPTGMDFHGYVSALFADEIDIADQTVSDALDQGRYAVALQPWVEAFGAEQIEVIGFEEVASNGAQVVETLLDAAGARPGIDLRAHDFGPRNSSYLPASPALARATAWARRWVPTGRIRSWGGEQLRRVQGTSRADPAERGDDGSHGTMARLKSYYAPANEALAESFGIDVGLWR